MCVWMYVCMCVCMNVFISEVHIHTHICLIYREFPSVGANNIDALEQFQNKIEF